MRRTAGWRHRHATTITTTATTNITDLLTPAGGKHYTNRAAE